MPYLDCPRCRARFHTGAIYEPLAFCPRCGAPFDVPHRGIRHALRALIGRGKDDEVLDWEKITGSQYAARRVRRAFHDSAPPTA